MTVLIAACILTVLMCRAERRRAIEARCIEARARENLAQAVAYNAAAIEHGDHCQEGTPLTPPTK